MCDPITGSFLYPNHLLPTTSLPQFLHDYSSLPNGAKSADLVAVCGRINSKRESSSKLIFYDLVGSNASLDVSDLSPTASDASSSHGLTPHSPRLQIFASLASFHAGVEASSASSSIASSSTNSTPSSPSSSDLSSSLPAFRLLHRCLRRGDHIYVYGHPLRSKTGELSIWPLKMALLAPAWHEIPLKLTDPNTRYRNRSLDMLVNRGVVLPFYTRAAVIESIREFLKKEKFVEVDTPTLWSSHGGATARPFETSSVSLGNHLYMRISPELFLKQLIIGGMHRIFEIGKVFRNEGIDAKHNPEFTMIEVYQAYANYQDMKSFTQNILNHIISNHYIKLIQTNRTIKTGDNNKSLITVKHFKTGDSVDLDFSPPFREIDIMNGLQAAIGGDTLPDPNSDQSIPMYCEIHQRHFIPLPSPPTLPRLLDSLISHFLEPQCIQPTFLIHHPVSLSPLARLHSTRKGLTERFELFINGAEYVNAYSELNDPSDQRGRMLAQARAGQAVRDEETQPVDQEYCDAMEYGLPPTAGWGMGVDRLIMLLSGEPHIRDVAAFPIMKPEIKQEKKES